MCMHTQRKKGRKKGLSAGPIITRSGRGGRDTYLTSGFLHKVATLHTLMMKKIIIVSLYKIQPENNYSY